MAKYIKQGDIFGRIGSGIGKGLADQLPEEIGRGRLAAGLQNLGDQQGLSPFQAFTGLASLPGATPQMIESGSQLLRQQGMLNGAKGQFNENPNQQQQQPTNQFDAIRNQGTTTATPGRGLVNPANTSAALNSFIPKTLPELQDRAVELNSQNPGLYPDYQSAFQGAQLEDNQLGAQNAARQSARQAQKGVETGIRNELRGLESAANAKVPDNVYQKIEDKALKDVENGKDELTAAKDARDELDKISRDYSRIDSFGDMTLLAGNPKEIRSSINSLRKKFSDRNDSENFADALVGRNGLSNEFAHFLAVPPRAELANEIKSFPSIKPVFGVSPVRSKADIESQTQKIIQKLAPMLNKNDSPLAIGHELAEKGYDSASWRDYLIQNQQELNLSLSQIRELEKIDKIGQGFLNDWWLKIMGGL